MRKVLKLFIPFSRSYLSEAYGVKKKEVQILIEDDIIHNFILRLCRNSEVAEIVVYSNDLIRCRDIQSSKLRFAHRDSSLDKVKSRREIESVGRQIFKNEMFAQVNPLFPLLSIETIRSVLNICEKSDCNSFMGISGTTLKLKGPFFVHENGDHTLDYGAVTGYGRAADNNNWKCFGEHLSIETLNLRTERDIATIKAVMNLGMVI